MKRIRITFICFCLPLISSSVSCQNTNQVITKNGMTVKWEFKADRIHFEISAPTAGWVTIGFNTHSGTKGAYLLMGHIVNDIPSVVEHYTLNPGNYKSLEALGKSSNISDVSGKESDSTTRLTFSLPINKNSQYRKTLKKDLSYYMIMAFSQDDDFQHHSIMRTSIQVKL